MIRRPILIGSGVGVTGLAALLIATSELPRGHFAYATSPTPATAPLAIPSTPSASPGAIQNVFVDISDKLMPSVVNISTTKNVRTRPHGFPGFPGFPGGDPWGGVFEPPFEEGKNTVARAYSLGTGFVIQAKGRDGLILTNHHVIAGADDVSVKFTESNDEREIPAEVIGKDPELDIALLRVKADRDLTPVALGDSDKLKVGEWIAAIGNPFGHGHSVSHGIVSAKERTLPGSFGRYLQLDAPINPGNSGGPLVNLQGEVVGINNAIDARGPGIGFAIPINAVKELLPQLEKQGRVERGFIGVNIMPLKPELARALRAEAPDGTPVVTAVAPGQPAAQAGIQPYDIITKVNGQSIKSPEELMQTILKVPVGKRMKTEVIRNGKAINLEVTIAARPDFRQD